MGLLQTIFIAVGINKVLNSENGGKYVQGALVGISAIIVGAMYFVISLLFLDTTTSIAIPIVGFILVKMVRNYRQ